MNFLRPDLLSIFFVLIPIVIVFIIYYQWQKKIATRKINFKIFSIINPLYSSKIKIIQFILKLLVVIFLILALCGPRIGSALQTVERKGVDVVFALDISKSMLVEDVSPSRLIKAKKIISSVIGDLVSDRLGLIVYAGDAQPRVPLTFNYSHTKLLLESADTDIVSSQGTDIGSVFSLSKKFFTNKEDSDKRNQILFIVSDGEDHEGSYKSKIEDLVKNHNVVISAINIGTSSGGPIPIRSSKGISYKKDNQQNTVISKSNSSTLKEIVSLGNGSFIKTQNTEEAVDFVFNNMSDLESSLVKEETYIDYKHQFQWFLAFALFFLVIEFILIKKKSNFIKKIIQS